jgi:hypothetical protein
MGCRESKGVRHDSIVGRCLFVDGIVLPVFGHPNFAIDHDNRGGSVPGTHA